MYFVEHHSFSFCYFFMTRLKIIPFFNKTNTAVICIIICICVYAMYVHEDVCVFLYICGDQSAYICLCLLKCMYVYACLCACGYVCVWMHVCVCIYAYLHVYFHLKQYAVLSSLFNSNEFISFYLLFLFLSISAVLHFTVQGIK